MMTLRHITAAEVLHQQREVGGERYIVSVREGDINREQERSGNKP